MVAAKGGYFDDLTAEQHMDDAKATADDAGIAEQLAHLLRRGVGGDVEVLGLGAQDLLGLIKTIQFQQHVRQFQGEGQMREGSPLYLLHLISGALTYNLMVAPATLRATHTDLASEESIARQVGLLQSLLAPTPEMPD